MLFCTFLYELARLCSTLGIHIVPVSLGQGHGMEAGVPRSPLTLSVGIPNAKNIGILRHADASVGT